MSFHLLEASLCSFDQTYAEHLVDKKLIVQLIWCQCIVDDDATKTCHCSGVPESSWTTHTHTHTRIAEEKPQMRWVQSQECCPLTSCPQSQSFRLRVSCISLTSFFLGFSLSLQLSENICVICEAPPPRNKLQKRVLRASCCGLYLHLFIVII